MEKLFYTDFSVQSLTTHIIIFYCTNKKYGYEYLWWMCHISYVYICAQKMQSFREMKKKICCFSLVLFYHLLSNAKITTKNCLESLFASGTLYANYNISMNKHKPFLQCMPQIIIITDLENMNRK